MTILSSALQARLAQPLSIGSVTLHSRVLQSPLSGVTDKIFRRLVRRYAPTAMLYTEMVHASGVCHVDTLPQIMEVDPDEHPVSIQLFDCRPDFLATAAQRAVAEGADTIDLNMGCPVNKITRKGGGSSLLKDPETAAAIDLNMGCPVNKITRKGGGSSLLKDPETAVAIVEAVVKAVTVPVSVKTRIGWDDDHINAVEFARRMEGAGAKMLTLHGRTRAQGYTGAARWDWIAQVKSALSIPVIANGDIVSVDAAIQCLEQTGADGVMCSRGTLGYPFLVGEIDYFLKTGQRAPAPTVIDRLLCAQEHLRQIADYKGYRGICQARKHMTWYAKGFSGAAELRDALCQIESVAEGEALLQGAIAQLATQGEMARVWTEVSSTALNPWGEPSLVQSEPTPLRV